MFDQSRDWRSTNHFIDPNQAVAGMHIPTGVSGTETTGASVRPLHWISPRTGVAKRIIDVAGAAALLLLMAPLLLLIALTVRADGGPALFCHRRVGRYGVEFGCLKFRTMRPDSGRVLSELLATDPQAMAEWRATRKLRADPRVTPLGRILRVTSLDELPQLINILRGEMSLVGPRPVLHEELKDFYVPAGVADAYLAVRPGLTGLWQIGGRSDVSYSERVALDASYVRGLSLRQDLRILLRTAVVVVRRRGSY